MKNRTLIGTVHFYHDDKLVPSSCVPVYEGEKYDDKAIFTRAWQHISLLSAPGTLAQNRRRLTLSKPVFFKFGESHGVSSNT